VALSSSCEVGVTAVKDRVAWLCHVHVRWVCLVWIMCVGGCGFV
jgi:hypothetical protein